MRGTTTAAVVATVAILVSAAAQLEALRERTYPASVVAETSLYVTSPAVLRRLTVSMNALAADVYWIRAIQYFGSTKERLAPLAHLPEPPPSIAWSSEYEQL